MAVGAHLHSVQVEVTYTLRFDLFLKVHVLLNVAHQQGCKLVTSGTSVKIYIFSFIVPRPN